MNRAILSPDHIAPKGNIPVAATTTTVVWNVNRTVIIVKAVVSVIVVPIIVVISIVETVHRTMGTAGANMGAAGNWWRAFGK